MKILGMVLASLLATAAAVAAQSINEDVAIIFQDMQTKKMEKVVDTLKIDEDTVDTFMSLYEEFQYDLEKENEKFTDLIWEYLDKSDKLTDERARSLVQTYLDLEEEGARLRKAYMARFGEILTPLQLVHLFQFENKAEALVRYKAATYIPLLN